MLTNGKKSIIAKVLLFVSTIIWGSSYFIIKNALDEVPVYFLLSIRFLLSAVVLSVVFFKKWKKFNKKYLFAGSITGIFLALAYIFQTLGLDRTTPGTGAFLTVSYCIIVPFLIWIVKKKRPSAINFIASFLCVLGIGMVCVSGGGNQGNYTGEILVVLCGVFFALQIVAVGVWGENLDIILYTIVQMFVAFLICFVISLFTEKMPTDLSGNSVFSLLYLALGATCLCFVLMNVGIKYTSTISSSIILSLEAVFGVAFSMIFYGERLTLRSGIGFAIIFVAIILNEVLPDILSKRKSNAQIDTKKID